MKPTALISQTEDENDSLVRLNWLKLRSIYSDENITRAQTAMRWVLQGLEEEGFHLFKEGDVPEWMERVGVSADFTQDLSVVSYDRQHYSNQFSYDAHHEPLYRVVTDNKTSQVSDNHSDT